ncbi:MAG: TerB family tellurite resistance protein [Xanthobacteraceae bacterium]
MPIVVLLVSTLAFWLIYWFVRMGGVDHFREVSARRKEEARRAKARTSERTAPLRAIDDPREAALVLMLLIPRGSDPTRAQFSAIEETMRVVLGFDADLIERLTQARFIASCAESFDEAVGLFADLFTKRLTADERRELVAMVEKIARIDGPSHGQTAALEVLQQRVGLAPA